MSDQQQHTRPSCACNDSYTGKQSRERRHFVSMCRVKVTAVQPLRAAVAPIRSRVLTWRAAFLE